MHEMNCANCMRKMTCEVYLSTAPVGYSGSLSTVNETNCNKKVTLKKKSHELHQLHSDVSHHDVLEEGCHLLYCSGEMGSSVETIFDGDSSSKIRSESRRPSFA